MAPEKKGRGRLPVTGRFATRAELEAYVWAEYPTRRGRGAMAALARSAGVSAAVVNTIVNRRPD